MTNAAAKVNKTRPGYYHATLAQLDGQPLFARGNLPTVHSSLTYAVWYIYWMSRLDRNSTRPPFYVYQLVRAERYLVEQENGLFSVSEVGSIPYDDRLEGVLPQAPELFRHKWNWAGQLTYVPARCLQRVSAATIRQEIDLPEWLTLCHALDNPFSWRGTFIPQFASTAEGLL